jgi:hypothetical protein
MLYRFRSPATGDVIMLGPQGDALLRALGREPSAKGILAPADMPQALRALEVAIAADEAARAGTAEGQERTEDAPAPTGELPLRRRFWPFIEMLRRSQAAEEPVTWGV